MKKMSFLSIAQSSSQELLRYTIYTLLHVTAYTLTKTFIILRDKSKRPILTTIYIYTMSFSIPVPILQTQRPTTTLNKSLFYISSMILYVTNSVSTQIFLLVSRTTLVTTHITKFSIRPTVPIIKKGLTTLFSTSSTLLISIFNAGKHKSSMIKP